MNSDETIAKMKLYTCPRCHQVLGPPTEDGRIEIVLEGGEVWYVIGARLDCACGMRQIVRPDVRVVPSFVKEWYPNGATEQRE